MNSCKASRKASRMIIVHSFKNAEEATRRFHLVAVKLCKAQQTQSQHIGAGQIPSSVLIAHTQTPENTNAHLTTQHCHTLGSSQSSSGLLPCRQHAPTNDEKLTHNNNQNQIQQWRRLMRSSENKLFAKRGFLSLSSGHHNANGLCLLRGLI